MENGKLKMENVNHIKVIERMMECLKPHTVDGVPIRPTLEAAKAALEKQAPKKVVVERKYYACPTCSDRGSILSGDTHCVMCGQALDWSEQIDEWEKRKGENAND